MRKRFAIRFLLLFLTIVTVGGCTMIPKKREKKLTYAEEMQRMDRELNKHLDKKYGTIVFRQKAFEGSNFLHHKDDRWYLEADLSYYWQKDLGKGTAEFEVRRYETEDGEAFQDNFFGLIIKKDFEEWVANLARPYFPTCKVEVVTQSLFYPNELTIKSGIRDVLHYKNDLQCLFFYVLVEEDGQTIEEFQSQASKFVDEWEKQGILSWAHVYYMTKKGYETFDLTKKGSFLKEEEITYYERSVGDKSKSK